MTISAVVRQTIPDPSNIQLSNSFDVESVSTADVVFAGVALIVGLVLSRIAKRGLIRFFRSVEGMPEDAGVIIARLTGYLIFLIGLMVALEALGFSWGPLGGILIIAVVVALFAAKPLLEDLGASLILQVRRPFVHDDLVTVDDTTGEVQEVTSRTVVVRTVDGTRVYMPSRSVLNVHVRNLSAEGARLSEFFAGVEYSTDLDRACRVAVDAMAASPGVLAEPTPEALVSEFADSTINIACRFWHEPDVPSELRGRDEAMRSVKRAFDAQGIVIAFPQRVLWRADE